MLSGTCDRACGTASPCSTTMLASHHEGCSGADSTPKTAWSRLAGAGRLHFGRAAGCGRCWGARIPRRARCGVLSSCGAAILVLAKPPPPSRPYNDSNAKSLTPKVTAACARTAKVVSEPLGSATESSRRIFEHVQAGQSSNASVGSVLRGHCAAVANAGIVACGDQSLRGPHSKRNLYKCRGHSSICANLRRVESP